MRTGWLLLGLAALLLVIPACDQSLTDPSAYNTPAVGNERNAFAYAVDAMHYTGDRTYDLSFDADSASVGLSVARFTGGSGTFELLDADGTPLLTRDLAGNTADGAADVPTGRPATARLHFSRYSGVVAIGVSGHH